MKYIVQLARVEFQAKTVEVEAATEEEAVELAFESEEEWEVHDANETIEDIKPVVPADV